MKHILSYSLGHSLPSKNPNSSYRYKVPGTYKVRLKVINSEGLFDTTSLDINVNLGASAPIVDFSHKPEDGHILSEYLFDASGTYDDEDSLSTLKFRWDFNSDGIWDTPFSNNPIITHTFGTVNNYEVNLQVQDPTGLNTFLKRSVIVGLIDSDLFVDFTWLPENPTDKDTVQFDASYCHHPDYPDMVLEYKWLFEEGSNWTDFQETPFYEHRFGTTRTQAVRLLVKESRGLNNSIIKEIHLNRANRPPNAHFRVSIPTGNIQTQFYLDAWGSIDEETIPTELQIRWDFDSDGSWDTNYSLEKRIYHQFPEEGKYEITMEVKDNGNLTDQFTEIVNVSPYSNQTGMVIDKRDNEIYGTVKIGNQWWFAENLKYAVPRKMFRNDRGFVFWSPWEPWKCLEDYSPYCDLYGKYYHIASGIDNTHLTGEIADGGEVDYELCPDGWRLPINEELDELVAFVGENRGDRLAIGGDTDFNLQYLGVIDWYITWIKMYVPEDTIYIPKHTYQEAWLYSQEEPEHENRTDIYAIKIFRANTDIWKGTLSSHLFAPLRCIRDD